MVRLKDHAGDGHHGQPTVRELSVAPGVAVVLGQPAEVSRLASLDVRASTAPGNLNEGHVRQDLSPARSRDLKGKEVAAQSQSHKSHVVCVLPPLLLPSASSPCASLHAFHSSFSRGLAEGRKAIGNISEGQLAAGVNVARELAGNLWVNR